jgi:hypothetical protein
MGSDRRHQIGPDECVVFDDAKSRWQIEFMGTILVLSDEEAQQLLLAEGLFDPPGSPEYETKPGSM